MGQRLPSKCMAFGWSMSRQDDTPRPRARPFAYAFPHVHQLLVFLAACGGGAINSVVGGGTPGVFERLIPALILFATLLFVVQEPLQQMNGLKNLVAVAINGIAIVYLAFTDLILWENALLMAVGAIVGALIGAGTARRVGQAAVRYVVVGVGLAMTVSMFLRL